MWFNSFECLIPIFFLFATVGTGAYGVVYKASDSQTGSLVALKKIKTEVEDDGIPATALREIVFLRQLKHPNVVTLRDIVMEPGKYLLVFEYMDSDLHSLMKNVNQPLAEDVVQSYTNQMLEGLAYCHSMGVMHRYVTSRLTGNGVD